MGLLLFKFLPYIWPLLKEFLEGKKDHPYFKDGVRAKSKSKLFVFILLFLLLATGNWAYDLHQANKELSTKIDELPRVQPGVIPERQYSREHIDLALCQKDREDLSLKLKEKEVFSTQQEVLAKSCATELEWERLNRPLQRNTLPPTPSRKPNKSKEAVGDEVQKQLEELRKKEGIGNAPH